MTDIFFFRHPKVDKCQVPVLPFLQQGLYEVNDDDRESDIGKIGETKNPIPGHPHIENSGQ